MTGVGRIDAVTVDLDDTLYPQSDWLAGAWLAVAEEGARHGLDRDSLYGALVRTCSEGSDRGRIIDRALAEIGAVGADLPGLVATFTAHRPAHLSPYPGVRAALSRLRERGPVVCVTDGLPDVQRAKVSALGLLDAIDGVVVSDELGGRQLRKPNPTPFLAALHLLGLVPDQVVHIGDRPDKDVEGAAAAGLRCVRVRTGEYAAVDGARAAWAEADSFASAADICLEIRGTPSGFARL